MYQTVDNLFFYHSFLLVYMCYFHHFVLCSKLPGTDIINPSPAALYVPSGGAFRFALVSPSIQKLCDNGGKVAASMSYGHISRIVIDLSSIKFGTVDYKVKDCLNWSLSSLLTLILLEPNVISLCHKYRTRPACTSMQSGQVLYCWQTNFKFLF